jgi:ribose transport system permease protein
MSFVILSGHMDLSVGAIMTFTGLIVISFQNFMPPLLAILCAILVGLMIGLLNGFIVTLTHANSGDSLMITFGSLMVISGFCLIYTGGFSLGGSKSAAFNSLGTGTFFGVVPISVVILIVCVGIMSVAENKFTFGRYMHFIGYNAEASRLAGLPVNMIKIVCYGISGIMAALGAIILSARTLGATPTAGIGYEMDAIVAITLGGMSLAGGYGRILNTLIGVVILGVIGNIMNLFGFVAFDQMIVKGLMLIGAVTMNTMSTKQIK